MLQVLFSVFLFIFISPFVAFASGTIEVPFNQYRQTLEITIEKSRCTATGEKAYILETQVINSSYNLICKLRPPIDQYDSVTPIKLMENFKYPQSITQKINESSFEDLKKRGQKAIHHKKHSWGTEYWWQTPTFGSQINTYLCPKRSKHCYEIIHGGIEFLTFQIRVS